MGVAILASAPHLLNSLKRGRAFKGFFGISETLDRKHYRPILSEETILERKSHKIAAILGSVASVRLWTLPGLELSMGKSRLNTTPKLTAQSHVALSVIVVVAYLVIVLVCIITNAPLVNNPNRAGTFLG